MYSDRCFLLWRDSDRVVAAIGNVPYGEPDDVWFEGEHCRSLNLSTFFNHILVPNHDPAGEWRIVGFTLCVCSSDDAVRNAMRDLLRGTNVTGDEDWLTVTLTESSEAEDDAAQGFWLEAFVSPSGRTIVVIPEWNNELQIGFDIVTSHAPTVSKRTD
jgi:hypothetical protein